ncbi:hypothetical protein FisN_20Hu151 [Fistulifera solaris]|uniref:Uncharacterized protein n=1 Tax=Fistulifera solaris TaxID=1519565 RepID=A0A1Z5KCF4_FISSO|nr:hypothetical protein FisN_20Hu151 [Fistulifera solaris]|eukprot:GAX23943.1 hypothetical protein FisN_20Hu151 [Fistulifera solaris]
MAARLEQYRDSCQDLVVYGVGFGSKYTEFTRATADMDESVCSFHFVLPEDVDAIGTLRAKNQIIVPVNVTNMPYQHMRRNVKIFKMSPLDLFPWADRVIWRDTKLLPKKILPSSYMSYFNDTIQSFNACVSFVSLPVHDSSMGQQVEDLAFAEYLAHCDAVVASAVHRPTVSDGIETVIRQCQLTLQHYRHEIRINGTKFLDRSLIDGAFIVFDQRSSRCRKYSGDLMCSWLDEVHCFSDRDQVSFGRALDVSGARQSEKLPNGDQVFFQDNLPAVHLARSDCHWYFQKLDTCYDTRYEKLKVAVVIAGKYERFVFNSTMHHLLAPLVRQSHAVDFFLSLTVGTTPTHRFPGTFLPDVLLENKTGKVLEQVIAEQVHRTGAFLRTLRVSKPLDLATQPLIREKWQQLEQKYPGQDPLALFPVLDVRNDDARKRNAVGNQNLLRLYRAIEDLWESLIEQERVSGSQYDYVMFWRDDALWIRDLYLNGIIARYGDVFLPSCDKRDPPLHPLEVNDHGLITRRAVAEVFGRYFSGFFQFDVDACVANLANDFTEELKGGCSAEMMLKWTADTHNITITKLGQRHMPFQRFARVQMMNGSITECFYEYCQSRYDGLIFGSKHANTKTCLALGV